MAEQRELWPGAGLWLDFRSIADADHERVEQCINQIAGLQAKIIFLKQLLETYNCHFPKIEMSKAEFFCKSA